MNPAYLADKSALARMTIGQVNAQLEPLLSDGLVATCGIVDLEVGYSARNAAVHRQVRRERRALPKARIDDEVLDRALDVQGELAERGQHRLPIPDLIIAAAAELAGLVVLHYDADFEVIADVTGQPHEWVVVRGSV
ncbi:MAG: PIN domain nuclease [Actinobacteria bacterium]|nr:PIN domain nuclease [Actinomycetota bacterium]